MLFLHLNPNTLHHFLQHLYHLILSFFPLNPLLFNLPLYFLIKLLQPIIQLFSIMITLLLFLFNQRLQPGEISLQTLFYMVNGLNTILRLQINILINSSLLFIQKFSNPFGHFLAINLSLIKSGFDFFLSF